MAIDFPNTPTNGQIFTVTDKSWIWDGTVWKTYGASLSPTVLKVDSTNSRVGINNQTPVTALDVTGTVTARAASTQDGVALAGRAGGTSTYEVTMTPTTLTADRTLTLPDATGTVALTSNLKILQVVTATYSTFTTHNSTTYSDTGLTANITPSSTSSLILVSAFMNGTVKGAENSGNALNLQVLRGATQIQEVKDLHLTNTTLLQVGTCKIQVLDSPASVAALTYKVQGKNNVATYTVGTQYNSTKSTIVLMEISV